MHLDIFRKLCEQRRKFPVLYKLEFSTAAKIETNTNRHAMRRNNHSKNQNPKCIPFDYNRIVLEKVPGVPDSDYVNASYVDVSFCGVLCLWSVKLILKAYMPGSMGNMGIVRTVVIKQNSGDRSDVDPILSRLSRHAVGLY